MKKILVRAHMSPFDNLNAGEVLSRDGIGTNSGNMLFANSVIRTLMTEDTQVDTLNTGTELSEEKVDFINSEYDCVVMPFANAFRGPFQKEMRELTRFIKRLKIPCIINGIGNSYFLKGGIKDKSPYDDTVKEFIKAVLEKSAVIGTRGEVTSAYLSRLGFKEESEHRVIGCPSMFWYGNRLPEIKQTELTPESPVSVNWKIDLPDEIHRFIKRNASYFRNMTYVPQVTDEIRLMYYGLPIPVERYKKIYKEYPVRADDPWYVEDKARAFINVPSWFQYLSGKELSFGSRIHGNIAAILAGIPCYIIVSDYRILELAQYHHLPHINFFDLKEGDDIFRLFEKVDISHIYEGHEQRFEIYKSFLEQNGLDHIFHSDTGKPCPYDRKMKEMKIQPALTPFFSSSEEEKACRLAEIQQMYTDTKEAYKELRAFEIWAEQKRLDKRIDWVLKKIHRG